MPIKKVFVVNGLPGSGKNLFGELVGQILKQKGIEFLHTSSVLPIKHILLPKKDWDPNFIDSKYWDFLYSIRLSVIKEDWDGVTKDVFWRGIMSKLKTQVTIQNPSFINAWVMDKLNALPTNGVLFVDIREPEYIDALITFAKKVDKNAQVKTIFVESDINAPFDNKSDAAVVRYKYDIKVPNFRKKFPDDKSSKANLCKEAKKFVDVYI